MLRVVVLNLALLVVLGAPSDNTPRGTVRRDVYVTTSRTVTEYPPSEGAAAHVEYKDLMDRLVVRERER